MRIFRPVAAWFPALLAGLLLLTVLPAQWNHYRSVCPSTDVLTWDGNLRLTAVVDQYRDFRAGRIGRAALSVLDAPTWPAFRGILSLGVFALRGGPDVRADAAVTFFFYCALFASLLFAGIRLSRSVFAGGLITLLASLLLIHSRDLNMFALSAMLETQGMFFMLWSVYFLHRLYAAHAAGADSPSKWLIAGLFISTQGVFHTKYPYGVVLLLAIVGAEVLRRPLFYLDFAKRLHREHFGPVRLALIGVFVAALLLAAKWGLLGDASPSPRTAKRLVYLGFLIFVLDFNIHVYRRRRELDAYVPDPMKILYLWSVVPALIWLFMHPTRFNTTLGTQQRLPPGADALDLSYFRLFFRQFDENWIAAVFLTAAALALLITFIYFLTQRTRAADQPSGPSSFAGDALFMATLAIALQWIVLEFSTPNKQPRHVYHLIPALFLIAGLWVSRGITAVWSDGESRGRLAAGLAALLFTLAGGYTLIAPEPGLLSGDYFNGRNMCANLPRCFYEPARWHAAALNPAKRYMVINTYHDTGPPGRLLASHTDLLLRMRMKGKGDVRNDSRHRWKTWREFHRLLVLAESCGHPLVEARVVKRAKAVKSKLKLLREKRHANGKFCFREYRIESGG